MDEIPNDSDYNSLSPHERRAAGHYEVLGET
jgi:hypothetical protein